MKYLPNSENRALADDEKKRSGHFRRSQLKGMEFEFAEIDNFLVQTVF